MALRKSPCNYIITYIHIYFKSINSTIKCLGHYRTVLWSHSGMGCLVHFIQVTIRPLGQ